MEILEEIAALVEQGKTDAQSNYPRALKGQPGVREKVKDALAQGVNPVKVMEDGLAPGMRALGKKFAEGKVFVPDVLMAKKAMEAGMSEILPLLKKGDAVGRGVVVLGTVKDDIHDIGKNLVKMLLEGVGWEVADLGTDVSAQQFLEAAKEKKPVAVGVSALLTTTMEGMRDVVKALRDAGLKTPVIVGGAPLTDGFAKEIGAVYGRDPQAAIEWLDKLNAK